MKGVKGEEGEEGEGDWLQNAMRGRESCAEEGGAPKRNVRGA